MIIQELLTRIGFVVDPSGLKAGESKLAGFKTWIAGLGIGASVLGIGRMALSAAAQMESLNAQFTTMLGSSEAAKDMMAQMVEFSAATPFETMDVASAAQTLMGFGTEAKDVMETVRMLGDVAGANGQRFQSLALVFGQVTAAGRLQGQDLLQLTNAGFNPLQTIVKETGKSMGELKEIMEKGGISSDMVKKAFEIETSKGGRFFGNLENQSKAWQGVWSTMMDNIRMSLTHTIMPIMPMLKEIVTAIGQIDLSPIVEQAAEIAGGFDNWTDFIKEAGASAVWLVAQLFKVLSIIQDLSTVLKGVAAVWVAIWGAAKLQMIWNIVLAIKATGAAMLAAGTAAEWAGLAMGKAFAVMLNPLTAGLLTIIGIWMAARKIRDEFKDELTKQEEADQEDEFLQTGAFERELATREKMVADAEVKRLRDLLASGKQIDREELKTWVKRKRTAEENLATLKATEQRMFGDLGDLDPTVYITGDGGAVKGIQKQVSANSKTFNFNSTSNVNVDVKGAKGGTGLSARDVESLAKTAVRAQFNLQLRELVVAST